MAKDRRERHGRSARMLTAGDDVGKKKLQKRNKIMYHDKMEII